MNYCEKTISKDSSQRGRDKTYSMQSKNDFEYK